jgi:hypothetical protein
MSRIHLFLTYADIVNLLGANIMFISRDQNAGQNQNINVPDTLSETLKFKYIGTTLTNKNYINFQIKFTSFWQNACSHADQNILYFLILSKKVKFKTSEAIIMTVVLSMCV